MNLIGLDLNDDLWLLHFSQTHTHPRFCKAHKESDGWVVPFNLQGNACLDCEFSGVAGRSFYILDHEHEIIRWLVRLRETIEENPPPVSLEDVETAWQTASTKWYMMDALLRRWSKSPNVPDELKPPKDRNGNVVSYRNSELRTRRTVSSE